MAGKDGRKKKKKGEPRVRVAPIAPHADILAWRRENLRQLTAQRGGPTALAAKLGYRGPSFISQMTGPRANRVVTEAIARWIEQQLRLPAGSLDQPPASGLEHIGGEPVAAEPPPVPVDEPLFLQVADVLRPLLMRTPLPKAKAHQVFAQVYRDAEQRGSVDAQLAEDLIRLAS